MALSVAESAELTLSRTKQIMERIGLWKRANTNSLLTPGEQLNKALQESKVYEQLKNIHVNSPNAAIALKNKLSGLKNAALTADKTLEMPDEKIRYYEKGRAYTAAELTSRLVVTRTGQIVDRLGLLGRNAPETVINVSKNNQINRIRLTTELAFKEQKFLMLMES